MEAEVGKLAVPTLAATGTNGIRRTGWLRVLLGPMMIIGVAILAIKVGPLMLQPREGTTVTDPDGVNFLRICGALILFGLGALISGVLMIKTGRQSKWTRLLVLTPLIGVMCTVLLYVTHS